VNSSERPFEDQENGCRTHHVLFETQRSCWANSYASTAIPPFQLLRVEVILWQFFKNTSPSHGCYFIKKKNRAFLSMA
jgi:hypothetical protein